MESLASILLTLLVIALILAFANGGLTGPKGVSEWLEAKFVGQVKG